MKIMLPKAIVMRVFVNAVMAIVVSSIFHKVYAGENFKYSESESESNSSEIISQELMKLNRNDSVVLLVPEHACLHVNDEIIQREPNYKYCDTVSRFNDIPIKIRRKLKIRHFQAKLMRRVIDSIGFEQKTLAACTELRGVILGFKSDVIKMYKFDACNGYVDYVSPNGVMKTNLKSDAYDRILKMFHVDDHFWDVFHGK